MTDCLMKKEILILIKGIDNMYEINDILTLSDNNKYVITNKLLYNDKYYYMIIDYEDDDIWFIVYEDNDKLNIEENEEILYNVINNFKINI